MDGPGVASGALVVGVASSITVVLLHASFQALIVCFACLVAPANAQRSSIVEILITY